jgi:hypothetical protein
MPSKIDAQKPPTRAASYPAGMCPAAAIYCPAKSITSAVCTYGPGLSLCHLASSLFQWWQVEKVNPIKLYEENKVIAGFSLLNLLFKQGRAGLIRGVVDKLIGLYNQKKIKPVVDSLWALEEVRVGLLLSKLLLLLFSILAGLGSQVQY